MSGYILLLFIAATAGSGYLAYRVLIRLPQHFRSKQWLLFNSKLLVSLCLLPVACFGLLIVLLGFITYYPHRTFDKASWAKNVEQRYTMVDDLSAKAMGWNKQQVIKALGFPGQVQDDDSFRYSTGDPPQLFGGADPFEIIIEFHDDKVVRCYILET